jgi:hypothetical protein
MGKEVAVAYTQILKEEWEMVLFEGWSVMR